MAAKIRLSYNKIVEYVPEDDNSCVLIAMDMKQQQLLLSLLRYAEWGSIWDDYNTNGDTIDSFVAKLERCIMSGCEVSELIKTNQMIVAALLGQSATIDGTIPASVDYTTNGIGARLNALNTTASGQTTQLTNIVTELQNVVDELQNIVAEQADNDGLIDDLERINDNIAVVLGAATALAV